MELRVTKGDKFLNAPRRISNLFLDWEYICYTYPKETFQGVGSTKENAILNWQTKAKTSYTLDLLLQYLDFFLICNRS